MLGATVILSALQVLFTYLGELSALNESYTAWRALLYVLWSAPTYIYQVLPIAALIGAVLGLGSLASNSELIVMRSAGISLWRIVGWVIRSALILAVSSVLYFACFFPFIQRYKTPAPANSRSHLIKTSCSLKNHFQNKSTANIGQKQGGIGT